MRLATLILIGSLGYLGVIATHAQTRFVDDAGRTVVVARPPQRVMPAGPPADGLVFALAPDLLVGLVKPWTEPQRAVLAAPGRDLDIIPRLTPDPLKSDLAAVHDLKAELVVDYGDVTPKYAAVADRVTEATGIPAVLLDGHLATTPTAFRRFGDLLGRDREGETLARLAEATLAKLAPLAGLTDAERVPVYLARGYDGLDAVAAGSTLDEAVRFAGGRNVVARTEGAFRLLTPADVAALAPRVVIVEETEAAAADAPLRRALPADAVFLLDLHDGFHWVENPPSVNRLVGAAWLARRLHPDRATIDEAGVADLARRLLHVREP